MFCFLFFLGLILVVRTKLDEFLLRPAARQRLLHRRLFRLVFFIFPFSFGVARPASPHRKLPGQNHHMLRRDRKCQALPLAQRCRLAL